MMHRNLTTRERSLMALESLMKRGELADWREFVRCSRETSNSPATDCAER